MASCDTEGVLAAVTGVVASIECAEALKLLTGHTPKAACSTSTCGSAISARWRSSDVPIVRPVCAHQFEYLNGDRVAWTTVLCGRNSVQIVPPEEHEIDLPACSAVWPPWASYRIMASC